MKNTSKQKTNGLATKQDLKNTDLLFDKKLQETEGRLNLKIEKTEGRLNKRIDGVMKYIDFRLEPLDRFQKEFNDFKERVMKTLDWLVGAFKKFDEEHTVMGEQLRRIDKRLDQHETLIKS